MIIYFIFLVGNGEGERVPSKRKTSVDDILNELDDKLSMVDSSPAAAESGTKALSSSSSASTPLQPHVMTATELDEQKKAARASRDIER